MGKINIAFSFKLFGYTIPVSETIVVMWLIMAVLILLAYVYTRKLNFIPAGPQNIIESYIEMMDNLALDLAGKKARMFVPYISTILIFLAISNLVSIFNIFPTSNQLFAITGNTWFATHRWFGITPPTRDVSVTLSLAFMSIVMTVVYGIKAKTFKGWLKTFIEPVPIVLPFKIIEILVRIVSLCLRLFGNIIAAFVIMEILYSLVPILLPAVLSIYFDLFDGILQAFVFVFLTTLYLAEAIE